MAIYTYWGGVELVLCFDTIGFLDYDGYFGKLLFLGSYYFWKPTILEMMFDYDIFYKLF